MPSQYEFIEKVLFSHAASAFGYSIRQIMTLGLEYMRPNGSPTDKLLWDFCTRDVTVGEFQEKLSESNLLQGLSILHAGGTWYIVKHNRTAHTIDRTNVL